MQADSAALVWDALDASRSITEFRWRRIADAAHSYPHIDARERGG